MIFKADIVVRPTQHVNDSIGKTVLENLNNHSIKQIKEVKIGKYFMLEVEANSKNAAAAFVEEACKSVLVDESNESFEFTLDEV